MGTNTGNEEISFMLRFKVATETNTHRKEARTPLTWAASLASLVVNAPVVFLGSSNQLTSCGTENGFILLEPKTLSSKDNERVCSVYHLYLLHLALRIWHSIEKKRDLAGQHINVSNFFECLICSKDDF